ncbi:MAG: hypothetical protein BJBARM5_0529 [Candidatus Parvarchaeum acidophilus ARMAN-5]|uniref:DUF2341 domain-containing protein n=1 Tax=Candidatus Parvarchaeum acidophilus ARMAN-5 TaxID=662762 RepID=D6GVL6_PARA5|nr:MAG: hypothetical protein BJBARM5_0529 [Candidatus Parvarchaeum acidophilus ARMAN-5]
MFNSCNGSSKEKASDSRSYIYSYTHTQNFLHINLNQTKRSQSALEYMMTYGWAILIIVIVAVILYSMGIFNPSSAITTTSSGFSPFVIQSAVCTADGLAFSVLAGPISEPVVQINKVYLTSAAGTNSTSVSYTLPKAVTLASGSSTLVVIPGIHCTAVGTKFSSSGSIEYSYSTPAGNEVLNSTGTLAGTTSPAPAKLPSTIEYFIPITVSNKQSSATSQPFQQMVNVTSSSFSPYAAPNFQNVEFFYSNGTVIPSWLENYTGSHALYWLKTESIPASTSITVYMGFAPTSTNLFNNVNTGEAPQLSLSYAEYDDGADVFNNYWNFAGTSLPSGWASSDTAGYSQNNGIAITKGSVYTTSPMFSSLNNIEEMYAKYTSLNSGGYSGIIQSNTNAPSNGNGGSNAEILWMTNGGQNSYIAYSANGAAASYNIQNGVSSSFTPTLDTYYLFGTAVSSSEVIETINYVDSLSVSGTYTANQYIILGYFTGASASTTSINPIYIQYVRTRAYPPNGVMPSVSFGSVS